MRRAMTVAICLFAVTVLAPRAGAHCEIPCGIYGDAARFDVIEEHCQTIEKSMAQVTELSAAGGNDHQLVRWVTNKEDHANKIQAIVSQYFLTQRIKPTQANYEGKVVLLHQMLVAAMKCKQTTDPAHVEQLRNLASAFRDLYFKPAEEQHVEEHSGSGSK